MQYPCRSCLDQEPLSSPSNSEVPKPSLMIEEVSIDETFGDEVKAEPDEEAASFSALTKSFDQHWPLVGREEEEKEEDETREGIERGPVDSGPLESWITAASLPVLPCAAGGPADSEPASVDTAHGALFGLEAEGDLNELKTAAQLISNSLLTSEQQPEAPSHAFHCSFCGKAFTRQRYRLAHERLHTKAGTYPCSFCGKVFSRQCNKLRHERIHTGVRPYTCHFCGKAFSENSGKKIHERIHTGERPYSCAVCGKTFTQQCHKALHERTHTEAPPFTCTVCGRSFSHKQSKIMHERSHRLE